MVETVRKSDAGVHALKTPRCRSAAGIQVVVFLAALSGPLPTRAHVMVGLAANPHSPGQPSIDAAGRAANLGMHAAAGEPGSPCYVNVNVVGGANDGSSWMNAYMGLQAALSRSDCHEVWVAKGTYLPTFGPGGRNRFFNFTISPQAVFGGFDGIETSRDQRDWQGNPTILSCDLDRDDQPGFVNRAENCYHVAKMTDLDPSSTLDGFIVRGGNADLEPDFENVGGGILIRSSSVPLSNLVFTENRVVNGVNFAAAGGGLYVSQGSQVTVRDAAFIGNQGDVGGAVAVDQGSAVDMAGANLSGNQAFFGAAFLVENATLDLTNATVYANTRLSAGSTPFAVVLIDGGSTVLNNVTLNANEGAIASWVIQAAADIAIHNSILWGNAGEWGDLGSGSPGTYSVDDSVIQGGCPASFGSCIHVLDEDPRLGSPENHGGPTRTMALAFGSPAIDTAGGLFACTDTDQRGVARPQGLACDMGAFESDAIFADGFQ